MFHVKRLIFATNLYCKRHFDSFCPSKCRSCIDELFDYVSAHILLKHLGNVNSAVVTLIILHYRRNGSANRNARAVKGVNKLSLVLNILFKADGATACLIILKVRTAGDFNISAVRRHPNLNVIGFCRGKT